MDLPDTLTLIPKTDQGYRYTARATASRGSILVQLGAGVGNIVLATPLLVALHELGFTTDVLLAADYADTAALLSPWSMVRSVRLQTSRNPTITGHDRVIPAVPPFYQARFGLPLRQLAHAVVTRPRDSLFYENEQEFYLSFARALGYPAHRAPAPLLPIGPSDKHGVTASTVVLAPGCKTGEMAAKRWPYFPELAHQFTDVVVVGTSDDLRAHNGAAMRFAPHVRSVVDNLTLRETAELIASAGVVVANDSGLGHVASAVGVRTILLFGPTPHETLGRFSANTEILRSPLPCQPCWFDRKLVACHRRVDCLAAISVERVAESVRNALA